MRYRRARVSAGTRPTEEQDRLVSSVWAFPPTHSFARHHPGYCDFSPSLQVGVREALLGSSALTAHASRVISLSWHFSERKRPPSRLAALTAELTPAFAEPSARAANPAYGISDCVRQDADASEHNCAPTEPIGELLIRNAPDKVSKSDAGGMQQRRCQHEARAVRGAGSRNRHLGAVGVAMENREQPDDARGKRE